MIQLPRFAPDVLEDVQRTILNDLLEYSPIDKWAVSQGAFLAEEFNGIDFDVLGQAMTDSPKAVNKYLSSAFINAAAKLDKELGVSTQNGAVWCGFGVASDHCYDLDGQPNSPFVLEISSDPVGYSIDGLLNLNCGDQEVVLSVLQLVASIGYAPYTPLDCLETVDFYEVEVFDMLLDELPSALNHADSDTLQKAYGKKLAEGWLLDELFLDMEERFKEEEVRLFLQRFTFWRDMPRDVFDKFSPSAFLAKAPSFHIRRLRKKVSSVEGEETAVFINECLDSLERFLSVVGGDKAWKQYRLCHAKYDITHYSERQFSPIECGFLLTLGANSDYGFTLAEGFYSYIMETGEQPTQLFESMCPEGRWISKISYARAAMSEDIYRKMAAFSGTMIQLENQSPRQSSDDHRGVA